MKQFSVSDDGRLVDETASIAVRLIQNEFPWVDGPAIDTYLALSKAYWSLWSVFSAYCNEFELSIPRFNLLLLLYQTRSRPKSMTELGVHLNVSTANVTKMLGSLEQDGWAARVSDENDRRVAYGQLTPEGEARFKTIMPVLLKRMENLTRGLTEDEELLLTHLLTKMRLGLIADYANQPDSELKRKARAQSG
jgi:DNA-binding MarR family transcriptional regulator